MLSKKSERFLKEFRIEMMTRGKNEEYRDELEEELRDHLTMAEQNGTSLESVTGGSVKNYLKTLSSEIPETNDLKRNLVLLFVFLIGMFTIPSLIGGSFDYTLAMLFYYICTALLGPILFYTAVKFIFIRYTSLQTEKIDKMGIFLCVIYAVFYMGMLSGGLYLAKNYPLYELFELSTQINMTIGLILLGAFIMVTILMKKWFYAFLITAISLPDVISRLFINNDPTSGNYLMVSSILVIIVNILVFAVLIFYSKKEDKNTSN
ncbi:hypothetical protein [Salinicoccus albus]|uniref:hypothetical protein n=1 Tax=Salinicoccus albus TaxID=418756 RepID=UPI00037B4938|nr:hypothetical protein [Salinicoccus albus]